MKKLIALFLILTLSILATQCGGQETSKQVLAETKHSSGVLSIKHTDTSVILKKEIQEIEVKTYIDEESGGWAYKISDYAFEVKIDSCIVKYNVVLYKDKETLGKDIQIYTDCNKTFAELEHIHRAILKNIFEKYSTKNEIASIYYHSFNHNHDAKDVESWLWNIPIIIESANSLEYTHYKTNYPNTKHNVNSLFVEYANKTEAYKELNNILNEFGVEVKLRSVEKVFTLKAGELPIYSYLQEQKIPKNKRIFFDVGMSWFKVSYIED